MTFFWWFILQIYSNEAEEYLPLPDTLDIGDAPETIETSTSTSSAPPKQKNASNEASASSSSTSSGTPTNAPVSSSSWFDESLRCEVLKFLDMVILGEISFYIVHNALFLFGKREYTMYRFFEFSSLGAECWDCVLMVGQKLWIISLSSHLAILKPSLMTCELLCCFGTFLVSVF